MHMPLGFFYELFTFETRRTDFCTTRMEYKLLEAHLCPQSPPSILNKSHAPTNVYSSPGLPPCLDDFTLDILQ